MIEQNLWIRSAKGKLRSMFDLSRQGYYVTETEIGDLLSDLVKGIILEIRKDPGKLPFVQYASKDQEILDEVFRIIKDRERTKGLKDSP